MELIIVEQMLYGLAMQCHHQEYSIQLYLTLRLAAIEQVIWQVFSHLYVILQEGQFVQ